MRFKRNHLSIYSNEEWEGEARQTRKRENTILGRQINKVGKNEFKFERASNQPTDQLFLDY
jgi:hypothetical protein